MSEIDTAALSGSKDQPVILIADRACDESSTLVHRLRQEGYSVVIAGSVRMAISVVNSEKVFFALTELSFEDGSGKDILTYLAKMHPYCRAIVHTAYCDVKTAVWAAKAGAADVLPKPTAVDFLIAILLEKDLRKGGAFGVQPPNEVREEHIRQVYLASGFNLSRTADRLMMHRRTLQRIMERSPSLRAVAE
jgi:two-component system response regulator RegA